MAKFVRLEAAHDIDHLNDAGTVRAARCGLDPPEPVPMPPSPIASAMLLLGLACLASGADAQQQPARPRTVAMMGTLQGPRTTATVEPYVRGRLQQLHFCFAERGLGADSALAGFVHVAFRKDSTRWVDSVTFRSLSRSWRGDGAAAAERCMRERFNGWRFPADVAPGTYLFTLGFAVDPVPFTRPVDWGPPPSPDRVLPSDAGVRTQPRGLPLFHVP